MAETLPLISNSQTDAMLLCERKHYYGYGLDLQRVGKSDALARGTAFHTLMQHYFELRMNPENTHLQAISETKQFALTLLDGTNTEEMGEAGRLFGYFAKKNVFEGWTILAVEKEFTLRIGDRFEFQFIIDLIARNPQGQVVIIDHKTTYDFYTDRMIRHMPQLIKYFGALRALGHKVDLAAYHQVRTREAASHTIDDKIRLVTWKPNDHRIKQIFHEQIIAAERILRRKQQTIEEWSADALRVNNNTVCKNCPFANLCVAELDDESPNLILRSEYMKKEKR